MKKFIFGGSRGVLNLVLSVGVLAAAGAHAQEISCYADAAAGAGGISPPLTEINVKVDKNNQVATGTWNGESIATKIEAEEDNLAEFSFKGGAEAGIWESEKSDTNGAKKWVGFIFPSEESGMYRLKCVIKGQALVTN